MKEVKRILMFSQSQAEQLVVEFVAVGIPFMYGRTEQNHNSFLISTEHIEYFKKLAILDKAVYEIDDETIDPQLIIKVVLDAVREGQNDDRRKE